jgi:hypothetical protein
MVEILTSSGIIAEAHSGKLQAAPSHAQQCCGRPSGPNIVFLKTCKIPEKNQLANTKKSLVT